MPCGCPMSYNSVGAANNVLGAPVYEGCAVIRDLRDRFVGCMLPKDEWTHAAHLAVAVCLLSEHSKPWMERRMPGFIRRYNESVGTPNTDDSGFHATVTHFYVRAVSAYLALSHEHCLARLVALLRDSPAGRRDFPLLFYSRDLLFSAVARRTIVRPDLRALRFTPQHFRPGTKACDPVPCDTDCRAIFAGGDRSTARALPRRASRP